MKGLSSTALQKTTSFAQPRPSCEAVRRAVSQMISPISRTAFMLMPARVEPTLTELHRRSVVERTSGIDFSRRSSAAVAPFCIMAE